MLALAEIQQRHDRGLLILRWIALQDLIDEPLVLRSEVERDARVVLWCVAMLDPLPGVTPTPAWVNQLSFPPPAGIGTHHVQRIAPTGRRGDDAPLRGVDHRSPEDITQQQPA